MIFIKSSDEQQAVMEHHPYFAVFGAEAVIAVEAQDRISEEFRLQQIGSYPDKKGAVLCQRIFIYRHVMRLNTVKFGLAVNNIGEFVTPQGHLFIGFQTCHTVVFQINDIFDIFLLTDGQLFETAEIFFVIIGNGDRPP